MAAKGKYTSPTRATYPASSKGPYPNYLEPSARSVQRLEWIKSLGKKTPGVMIGKVTIGSIDEAHKGYEKSQAEMTRKR